MRRLPILALLLPTAAMSATTYSVDAGRGPVTIHEPSTVANTVAKPLVVLLHGYSSNGSGQDAYMGFSDLVDDRGFVFMAPDGEPDLFGLQAWSATDACCGFVHPYDDATYLSDLLDLIEANSTIDPKQIYFVGHSNGGFMSYRMACDFSGRIAAIASLAGASWDDHAECGATEPVHILQIHGTNDDTIFFDGGCFGGACYPSATGSLVLWNQTNQCTGPIVRGDDINVDAWLPGDETRTFSTETCDSGGSLSLWASEGGHVPWLNGNFATAVIDYFFAHPKP